MPVHIHIVGVFGTRRYYVQTHVKFTLLSIEVQIYHVYVRVYRTMRTVYEKARIGIMCGLDEQLPRARTIQIGRRSYGREAEPAQVVHNALAQRLLPVQSVPS